MLKMQEEIYIVKLQRPADVSVKEMENYIWNALATWRGDLHPEHPLHDFNYGTLNVLRGTYNRLRKAASPSYKSPKVRVRSFDPHIVK